jgi:spore coat protein CotH
MNNLNVAKSRLFWLLLTPIYTVNIIFGTLMVLPYWIATGNFYYESKYFKAIMTFVSNKRSND